MIVKYETASERKEARIHFYKDDVFLIAQEAIRSMKLSMPIEDLFATSEDFVNFLMENNITESDVICWEIDDLKEEIDDILTFYVIISISFVKLCALRKTKSNAESIARSLVLFCNEYEDFSVLLKKLCKKEQERVLNGKRVDLLTYELKTIEKDTTTDTECSIVKDIVDSAIGLSVEGIQHVENALCETNDKHNHIFDDEVERLRQARKKKSDYNILIGKINDIHGNNSVNIGNKE